MIIITDSESNLPYLEQVISAFNNKPEYQVKKFNWRKSTTKESIDRAIAKLDDDTFILIGSNLLRSYTGLRPVEWDIQPASIDPHVYAVPSLGYVVRRGNDIENFAKVLSAAMFVEDTGGKTVFSAEEIPVTNLEELKECIEHVKQTGLACFDFETYVPTDEYKDYEWYREGFTASLVSISPQPGIGYTIPLYHFESPFVVTDIPVIIKELEDHIFGNQDIRKMGWNTKYDMHVLRKIGIDKIEGRYDDGMLMLSVLNNARRNYRLEVVAGEVFPSSVGYSDEVHKYKWREVPLRVLGKYAATDTNITMMLCAMYEGQMDERDNLLYRNSVAPAMKTLQKIEYRGMWVDQDILDEGIAYASDMMNKIVEEMRQHPTVVRYQKERDAEDIKLAITQRRNKIDKWEKSDRNMQGHIDRVTQEIREIETGQRIVTEEINFGSPKQISALLYHQRGFGFPNLKRGSTSEDVLREIEDPSGFIDNLLLLRGIQKTTGTYLEGMKKRIVNGRIHTTFTQHVTATGRLSSRNPNLQNIPNVYRLKDEELITLVRYVKRAFVPPKDHHIVQFDLSQAELRVMAEFSKDTAMREAYARGQDLHATTAAANLNIPLEDFYKMDDGQIKDHRHRAKARNFGLIYLMSPQGYREYAKNNYGVELTNPEAFKEHDQFFRIYPGVRRYHKIYEAKGKKFGYVRNWYGRKYWMEHINSADPFLQNMDIRHAINYPIQGTSGEYMVLSLVMIDQRLGDDIDLVNTIHDSAMAYIKSDQLGYYVPIVVQSMEDNLSEELFDREWESLKMGVDVEISTESWVDLEEIDVKTLG